MTAVGRILGEGWEKPQAHPTEEIMVILLTSTVKQRMPQATPITSRITISYPTVLGTSQVTPTLPILLEQG
jgi:hypothetical protein